MSPPAISNENEQGSPGAPALGTGDAICRILLQAAMDGFVLLGPAGEIREANKLIAP